VSLQGLALCVATLEVWHERRSLSIGVRVQRTRCRIAISVVVSTPPMLATALRPATKHLENSMNQFLTSQDASTPRAAAADALRRHYAELLS
jgi:hypothetical protein